MITYILETLAFQLVFLLAYDLFLKKETFFQWNRLYLLATFALSILLPWVKIEALKSSMPESLGTATIYLTQLDGIVLGPEGAETSFWELLPWYYWVLIMGSLVTTLWFGYKLLQIGRLRRKGRVVYFSDFTKVTVERSTLAFSFFRNIFLGEDIQKEKEANIIAHELVHVKQRHSLDLLFFELARIVFWFNPLVYVYQNRMAELHEFIADAQAVKGNKKEHFEMLLSEAFNTQHISFVNQFFNKSLIKKRIVMLQKKQSKAVWQLKYVLLLPLVLGMLVYTSCENEPQSILENSNAQQLSDENEIISSTLDQVTQLGIKYNDLVAQRNKILDNFSEGDADAIRELDRSMREIQNLMNEKLDKLDDEVNRLPLEKRLSIIREELENKDSLSQEERHQIMKMAETLVEKVNESPETVNGWTVQTGLNISEDVQVPFAFVEEAPIFPGCEDAVDKKACFQEKIQEHIRKNFHYPEEAQEQGIQGRVAILFTINKEGEIVDIKKKGPSPLLEAEAERIISRLPKMQPGKQKGYEVGVPFSIPITFKLQ